LPLRLRIQHDPDNINPKLFVEHSIVHIAPTFQRELKQIVISQRNTLLVRANQQATKQPELKLQPDIFLPTPDTFTQRK
jgi:hypothetical protein